MRIEDRLLRLKSMLTQVAGEHGLDALSPQTESVAHLAMPAEVDTSSVALAKLKSGQPLSPDEMFGLEAIILPDKRPVAFIRNNAFENFSMADWQHLNHADVHARLEPLFTSIGRVELPRTPTIPYGGTAFVVGPGVLMTNRHVARLFADGLGTHVSYRTGESAIDFLRERDLPDPDPETLLRVTDVLMIHPFWDMALLKVEGLPETARPLPLSVVPPEELVDRDVAVVGYPAQDFRNDRQVQDRVFNSIYGVKRMQPGKVRSRRVFGSFGNNVKAMTHDSSTLGGNSGSALIDVATGTIIGLHFAGVYLDANYAVPTFELARDSRVVDQHLNFVGAVPSTMEWAFAWNRTEGVGSEPSGQPDQPRPPVATTTTTAGSATFTLPLKITVSLGSASGGMTAGAGVVNVSTAGGGGGDAAVEKVPVIYPRLESRKGYAAEFLGLNGGLEVPMPELTSEGKAIAARLDDGSHVLHYHKFSLVMHKKRRLALFTAANVDWRPAMRKIRGQKPTRKSLNGFNGNESEDWVTDSRIPFDHQLPDYFYTRDAGAFDRGHLVRRDDVAWGKTFEDMQKGNGDTFHTTNCSPQTAEFNRSNQASFNWGDLEDMVQKQTSAEKVCIFSGPVFDDSDLYFHGRVKNGSQVSIQIPQRFWKIIVANHNGKPAAFGFVLDQDLSQVDLHAEMAVPEAWKQFLHPISEIESFLNGWAKLSKLKKWDQYEG